MLGSKLIRCLTNKRADRIGFKPPKKEASVFQELMPLLAQHTLLLMISRVCADGIQVNVIPRRVKSTDTDQSDARLTPLSLTGTPKELEEALPGQLVEFVGAHLELSSTLKSVKEQMDTAAKTAREAARKSTSGKAATSPAKTIPDAENVASPAPAGLTMPDPAPSGQLSGSLFGDVPAGEP